MNPYIEPLMTELRATIADLGKGGGSISPSVYDTAQVLRLYPPQDSGPAFAWLLSQQQSDGGWGSPETPYARDVPTLAAILALHTKGKAKEEREAVAAGLAFLRQQVDQWSEIPIDALPIAAEMILPYLLEEANTCGLTLDTTSYASLNRLRNHKLQQIAKRPLQVNTPPTYSWEALGKDAGSIRPDHSGGIGHSPAATATWLRQADKQPNLVEPSALARCYLAKAAASTGLDLPGVVPNVWPITGFELAYAPYALLSAGLLEQPVLGSAVDTLMNELWIIMKRNHGVSFGEYFTPDVDVTGVAMAALQATSRQVDPDIIFQFQNSNHFYTYQQELNPSVFSNAHALHALAFVGKRHAATEAFLIERQGADGRWLADKWHSSWLYTSLEVSLTLDNLGYATYVKQAIQGFIQNQKSDGGWGSGYRCTRTETSYAIIALKMAQKRGLLDNQGMNALQRGFEWLYSNFHLQPKAEDLLWLGKELYAPYRVDRIYELSAILSVILEPIIA